MFPRVFPPFPALGEFPTRRRNEVIEQAKIAVASSEASGGIRVHVKPVPSIRGYEACALDVEHLIGIGDTYEEAIRDFDRILAVHRRLLRTARYQKENGGPK